MNNTENGMSGLVVIASVIAIALAGFLFAPSRAHPQNPTICVWPNTCAE